MSNLFCKSYYLLPKILILVAPFIYNKIGLMASENPVQIKREIPEKLNFEISDSDARLEYARLLSYMKKYDESIQEYYKLLEQKPEFKIARFEMAKIFYYQENYQKALEILDEIPQDDEKLNDEIQVLKADIYLALKEYPKAKDIFENHLKSHPEDIASKFKLAELLSWQKKYKRSLELYREILAQRPEDIQVRRKYAMVLMWMRKFDESAEEMKKTLPNN